jgi:membrane-anchored protein YejM (alkaline phosphatase superfamily)
MTSLVQKNILRLYFLITYFVALWLASDSIPFTSIYEENQISFGYTIITFLLYGVYYILPAIVITKLASLIGERFKNIGTKTIYATAIVTGGLTTLLLYANAKIFSLYGMFFNGFILNLIVTPGGIESLGGSSASDIGFALIALGFFTLQAAILWLCHRLYVSNSNFKLSLKFVPVTVIMATIIVHMWFAVDHQTKNQLIIASESIPLYQTVSARRFLKVLGIDNKEAANIRVKGKLNYPLAAMQVEAPTKPYNIIWLTSESWRADTLNEKVMPNSWEFAKNAARFTKNYSGGNGTRMGVFSMFTGLPGSYWFPFLAERRGAYLIDLLKNQNYQMRLFTSARFTYPEFNQTIFSQVPKEQLQETRVPKSGWENDRDNVSDLLSFIDKRDPNKPFFTFMFFESPHARYYFPTNSVIAKPYRDDLNYATLSKEALAKDIGLIRNRYINSVHHLDMQYGRIFEYMKKNQLLDNTIVILIGDHGEEFMENGYWGHNSTFADPQVRTPLVIYKPGMKPFIEDQMTSHMDVIPTVMPLLGVKNPSSDYAIGYNLLAGEKRTHTYIADWNKVAYVDREVKITQPFNSLSVAFSKATAGDDRKLSKTERESLLGKKTNEIVQLAVDLRKFFKKSEAPAKAISSTKPI